MSNSPQADLQHVLAFARKHLYTTAGTAWQKLIASMVFETQVDLSLASELEEQDQARFLNIPKPLTPS